MVKGELKNLSDEELFRESWEGDTAAFDQLVERYKIKLYNFICRMIGDPDQAEDLLQETFIRVYRNRQEHERIKKFSTWTYTIAANLARDELRRRKRWSFVPLEETVQQKSATPLTTTRDPQDDLARAEIRRHILVAMESLNAKYRTAFILRDIEGLSYEEIGEVLSIPLGTAKSRVNRARTELQKRLRPYLNGTRD
jgi:RNA polymerase sigma-70 factor (ECF subfamily)